MLPNSRNGACRRRLRYAAIAPRPVWLVNPRIQSGVREEYKPAENFRSVERPTGSAFEKVYKLTHQGAPPITAAERQSAQNLARRMFYNLFRYKKIGNALPVLKF